MRILIATLLSFLFLGIPVKNESLNLGSDLDQLKVVTEVAFNRLPEQDQAYLYQVLMGHHCYEEWQGILTPPPQKVAPNPSRVFSIIFTNSGDGPLISACQHSSSDELAMEIRLRVRPPQFNWPAPEATPLELHLAQTEYILTNGSTASVRASALLEFMRSILLAHEPRACPHRERISSGEPSVSLASLFNPSSQPTPVFQLNSQATLNLEKMVEESDTPAEAGDVKFQDWIEEDCDLIKSWNIEVVESAYRPQQILSGETKLRRLKLVSVRMAYLLHEVLFRAGHFPPPSNP